MLIKYAVSRAGKYSQAVRNGSSQGAVSNLSAQQGNTIRSGDDIFGIYNYHTLLIIFLVSSLATLIQTIMDWNPEQSVMTIPVVPELHQRRASDVPLR